METFFDFRVNAGNHHHLEELCKVYSKLGYKVIAVNHEIDFQAAFSKNKLNIGSYLKEIPETIHGVKLLKRITLNCSDASLLRNLKHSTLLEFDIIAICPRNEDVLSQAIRTFYNHFHLITFDSTKILPFRLKHSHMNFAEQNNISIEVCYSHIIKDNSLCRVLVSNCKDINWTSRNRNIIISSNVDDPLYIRGPFDVINLMAVLGISFKSAKAGLTTNCKKLWLKAHSRKSTYNGIMSRVPTAQIDSGSSWIIPEKLHMSDDEQDCASLPKKMKVKE